MIGWPAVGVPIDGISLKYWPALNDWPAVEEPGWLGSTGFGLLTTESVSMPPLM